MLQFKLLSSLPSVQHGITQIGDAAPNPDNIVYGQQTHSDHAQWVDAFTATPFKRTDALLTKQSGITLGISTADCVPVLFADPRAHIVGAVHAGWRGTALEITRKTFEHTRMKPFGFKVGIGPAICPKCFVVGEEVARQFDDSVKYESTQEEGKWHVDLWQANVNQCLDVGIPERNIEVMRICTVEDMTLYSVRRGDKDCRNINWIRLST